MNKSLGVYSLDMPTRQYEALERFILGYRPSVFHHNDESTCQAAFIADNLFMEELTIIGHNDRMNFMNDKQSNEPISADTIVICLTGGGQDTDWIINARKHTKCLITIDLDGKLDILCGGL